ncbi:YihY/virulence factor BrkB family protein [Nocardioides rubriscoriae]|uniref:YihY/virulence factor BrkB family protein n=1 Tax=Nocardioides rubriscoriae TaxID=642762 RepID=UPI001FE2AFDB|nr:YihY/virulence factor BrkB family protein [Nocardioides rubriscoriae]
MTQRLSEARDERPVLDHVLSTNEHYGKVHGGQQAGAVTYFAFLSVFPVLALAFFAVGLIAGVYPEARANLTTAIESVLPGIVGPDDNQLSLDDVQSFSGLAGVLGLLGVLYAGLGWVSALREALVEVFETPKRAQPSLVKGKLRDLEALVLVGLVLMVSVAVAGLVSASSTFLLDLVGLGSELSWVVKLLAVALGLAANAVLFYALFRLLAEPQAPPRCLWSGALIGAVGFEVLKQLSGLLISATKGQPAFQAFGIALILVVWINYFSRLVLYAASWAHTAPEAVALRGGGPVEPVQGPVTPDLTHLPEAVRVGGAEPAVRSVAADGRSWPAPFAAGSATTLAVVALLRRRRT